MNNLEIWDKTGKTDTEYTKPGNKSGNNFTSIAPMYQFKQATTMFGPYGKGWGVVVGTEEFTTTPLPNDGIFLNYDAVLFYILAGERNEYPIHSTMPLCYTTRAGHIKADDDARKKVVTNAITKGLSMLGFNADIFMGEFDDPEYLDEVKTEFSIKKAEDKEKEIDAQRNELIDYVQKNKQGIIDAKTDSEAKGWHKTAVRHLNRQRNIKELTAIADKGLIALHKAIEDRENA